MERLGFLLQVRPFVTYCTSHTLAGVTRASHRPTDHSTVAPHHSGQLPYTVYSRGQTFASSCTQELVEVLPSLPENTTVFKLIILCLYTLWRYLWNFYLKYRYSGSTHFSRFHALMMSDLCRHRFYCELSVYISKISLTYPQKVQT